jgi:hypothetical protein
MKRTAVGQLGYDDAYRRNAVTEKPSPIASMAGGQIAIQTMLSLLINLYIAGCEDREGARGEIIKTAEDMIDAATIPDLPAGDQKTAREQAKFVVRALISASPKTT